MIHKKILVAILLYCLAILPTKTQAQMLFDSLFSAARRNNAEIVALEASRSFLNLETSRIRAETYAPRAYLSSDFLFAPYFNNNGKIISTNPDQKAFGYDVGITNGGLYSVLLNAEMPILNQGQVENLVSQNNLEIQKTETKIRTAALKLKHSLALQYLDVFAIQAKCRILEENLEILEEQLTLTRTLTKHGLYRLVDYRLLKTQNTADSIDLANCQTQFRLKLNELLTTCGISDTSVKDLAALEPQMTNRAGDTSLFLRSYVQDSLSAVIQQQVFENRYKPQVNVFANTGLNSTSLPYIEHHVGVSAGVQLTYTLFDGRQKQINHEQQMLMMGQAGREMQIKKFNIQQNRATYLSAIRSLDQSISQEKQLMANYQDMMNMYNDELKNGQVSIMDYLNFMKLYNQNKLNLENYRIDRSRFIIEYNFWNH